MRTHLFYCSNHPASEQLTKAWRGGEGEAITAIGLPCSGKVDIPYLVKAFETGADGVVVVTCPGRQCRHLEGTARAHKRAEGVEALLEEIGMGKGRMAVIEYDDLAPQRVVEQVKAFIGRVGALPAVTARDRVTNEKESLVT
jgi:coenzyme F420-reducing hydrogenase delta subunit